MAASDTLRASVQFVGEKDTYAGVTVNRTPNDSDAKVTTTVVSGRDTSATVNTLAEEGNADAPYHLDTAYKQANLSGTSMASPQIAGMIALWLQANPHATPADMKAWMLSNAGGQMWDYGSDGMDYQIPYSPWGGAAKIAYNKFNSANSLVIRNIEDC